MYGIVDMPEIWPEGDEIKQLANTIRLNGKTIYEWREDSRIYLADKLDAEKKNVRLNDANITLDNELSDEQEINRHLKDNHTKPASDST
jgi:hypothetical protein